MRGRPFSGEISDELLLVAERVMEEYGFSHLKVDNVVKAAGTTRATFYRRYSGISQLAFAVIANRFGSQRTPDTGHLLDDLIEMQKLETQMLDSQLWRNNLAGLLESVRTDQEVLKHYREQFIRPRRNEVRKVIERAMERGEIGRNEDLDYDFVCDVLLGPLLARIILPLDLPLNDDLARQTAKLAYTYVLSSAVSAPTGGEITPAGN